MEFSSDIFISVSIFFFFISFSQKKKKKLPSNPLIEKKNIQKKNQIKLKIPMEQIENDQIVTMTEIDSSSSSLSTATNEKTLVFIIPLFIFFLKKKN
jgi:hypothetical protein